jgi:hypothetical protein
MENSIADDCFRSETKMMVVVNYLNTFAVPCTHDRLLGTVSGAGISRWRRRVLLQSPASEESDTLPIQPHLPKMRTIFISAYDLSGHTARMGLSNRKSVSGCDCSSRPYSPRRQCWIGDPRRGRDKLGRTQEDPTEDSRSGRLIDGLNKAPVDFPTPVPASTTR